MPYCKILALPFLAQVKILESLDFSDLIRFANCSTKCSELVGSANPIDLKSSFQIKEKSVTMTIWVRNGDKREYKFVVSEINYNRENGFKWIGLGGSKFFECPGIGKTWDFLGGPPEDEFEDSDFENDNDSVNQNADDGADQISDGDEVSENGLIEDESEASEHSTQDSDKDSNADEVSGEESVEDEVERFDYEDDVADADQHSDAGSEQVFDGDEVPEDESIEDETEASEDGSDNDQDAVLDAEDACDVPNYDVAHPDFQKYYCKFSSPTGQSVFEVADLLITHFLKLFKRFEVGSVSLRPTDASKQLVEKHEMLRKCEDLGIVDFQRDFDHYRPLTEELMLWSIEALEPRGCAYLCGVIGEFMYEKGFKPESIEVNYGHWVHQNAILDSGTKTFIFYYHIPSSTYINTILKEWVSHEKMKSLKKIQWEAYETIENITEQFRKEVLDGIPEVIPTDEEREKIKPEFHKLIRGAEETVYFKFFRRVDGKLAVVHVDLEFSIYYFLTF